MFTSILLASALSVTPQAEATATRADMAIRVLTLERAWRAEESAERRAAAVTPIANAVTSFFSGRFDIVSRSIDEARAALQATSLHPSDALRLTVTPIIAEPGQSRTLNITWVYDPGSRDTVTLSYQIDEEGMQASGQAQLSYPATATLGLPADVNPIQFTVDGRTREVWGEVIPNFRERLSRLKELDRADLAPIIAFIEEISDGRAEIVLPVSPRLEFAEALAADELAWRDVEDVYRAQHNRTRFRAWFPDSFSPDTPVVVALHGAGGSEEMFFESYGAGLAVELAQERGWAIVSPQSTPQAVADVMGWIEEIHGFQPETLFVMGHSMGGGVAMQSRAFIPAAIALFAPAGTQMHPDLRVVPTFLAVGAQEMMMLRFGALSLRSQLEEALGTERSEFLEVANSEHLMIVVDALPQAFEFLARVRESP